METLDLYSLLKVNRNATKDEIHRAYKSLSTSFHPDKLPPTTTPEKREQIQEIFLEFKRANDVLVDPVLRLAYDYYGEDGVQLIKRIQQQRREQKNRREVVLDIEEDEEDDEEEMTFYDRVERLLETNPNLAREELQRFFKQHDYHKSLMEGNQVQLACNLEFPPVLNLKKLVYQGRDYIQYVRKSSYAAAQNVSEEEREYYARRIKQEQSLVDYQLNRFRDSQKTSVGFTLSSSVPTRGSVTMTGGTPLRPKWSMAMGGTSNLAFPEVAEVLKLAGKEETDSRHPTSMFINAVYQPVPETQINFTTNLSNNQSHQYVVGSSRTLSNRSSLRYNLTFLSKSFLDTNLIMNLKSIRHIKGFGLSSAGISLGGNGKPLQWNASWENYHGTSIIHKYSAKVAMGLLQGNSLELIYRLRAQRDYWLDEYLTMPKRMHVSTVISSFPKVEAMATQEFTCLATHPTLGLGFEHDITLGCWTWIWEWTYQNSSFRVPIPILHLGSISDPNYYSQKVYYGLYSLIVQSMVADLFQDAETKKKEPEKVENPPIGVDKTYEEKTKAEADRQLALMKKVAERKRLFESKRDDGLVILRATYWLESLPSTDPTYGRVVSMDATRQLQFWVCNGKLDLPSVPKSCWLGFYNLEYEKKSTRTSQQWDWRIWRSWARRSNRQEQIRSKPQLTIRYSHGGYVYEITIGETEAVVLPSTRSQLIGHISIVQ